MYLYWLKVQKYDNGATTFIHLDPASTERPGSVVHYSWANWQIWDGSSSSRSRPV